MFKFFSKAKKENNLSTLDTTQNVNISVESQIAIMMEQYIQSNREIMANSIENDDNLVIAYSKLVTAGLANSKNARILKAKIDDNSNLNRDIARAKNLISFVKDLRKHFGKSTFLISKEQFDSICKKYKLKTSTLSNYGGIIPDKNLNEIYNVLDKIDSFEGELNISLSGNPVMNVERIDFASSVEDEPIVRVVEKYVRDRDNMIEVVKKVNSLDHIHLADLRHNTDIPPAFNTYPYPYLVSFWGEQVKRNTLFIACPEEQLKVKELIITTRAVDPIVFQRSPYGIVIYSMWGEESEDKIFEEYKKINNLLSI